MNDVIEVELVPTRCLYPKVFNPSNDFYIYTCKTDSREVEINERYRTITIKGKMQRLDFEVTYKAKIKFSENHPTYGTSYEVISIYQELPKTVEAQKDYLRALITENQIAELYKAYPDDDIIELFKTDKIDINKVRGFGEIVYQRIKKKIIENLDHQELISNLGKYGVNYNTIVNLMKEFGSSELAIQKVKSNPYILTKFPQIGFKKADAIAKNMAKEEIDLLLSNGSITKEEAQQQFIEKVIESPFRIQSAIRHVIEQEQGSGHTYIERSDLLVNGVELLQIESELIDKQIPFTWNVYIEDSKVALLTTYEAEEYISNWIKDRLNHSTELNFDVEDFINRMEDKFNLKLSEQQRSFFFNIRKSNVNLLIGFAGTGKSLLQKLLKELQKEIGITFKWIAPTGNAAKILSGYIGEKASTAHKAIGYGQHKEVKDFIEILEDYVVNDETSMLDIFITVAILKKIKNPETRLLFIGDPFQIPSVAAGNLLHDMVESGVVPTTRLDVVFRQNEGGILDIATKIRLNQKFIKDDCNERVLFGKDMIIHCVEQEWMVDGYKHYYNKFLKNHKPEEIMVLSPTKKGSLGTVTINKEIQDIVNPKDFNKKEIEFGEDGVLRVGDFIINVKNTYDIKNVDGDLTEIVNGDKGLIYDIVTDWKPEKKIEIKEKYNNKYDDSDEDEEVVDLNGIYINFDLDDIQLSQQEKFQLLHAWCLTMHKSQGGNAKSVIVIADKSHKWQLSANLLYTAVTRSTDYCVIVCQAEVLNYAMRKVENLRRNTFLEGLLRD